MATSLPMVSIFGGSLCAADSREAREAYAIGKMLAEAGYSICTGGYQGTMAAASRGAFEAGGTVVGVTMAQINRTVSEHVTEERPTSNFYERLQGLISHSEAYVAVRGGVGTLVEVTLVWNKMTMEILPQRPIILVGRDIWEPWLAACQATLAIEDGHVACLTVVDTPEQVVQAILARRLQPVA